MFSHLQMTSAIRLGGVAELRYEIEKSKK